jgi:hypothetical protein
MQDDYRLQILATVREIKAALQDAHFAARRLEELLPAPAHDRPSDRIHALRIAAGELAAKIGQAGR